MLRNGSRWTVLEAFRLGQHRRWRAAYVAWLEARAENQSRKIDAKAMEAMEAIRGGWYLGEEGFKDKLLGLIDKAGARIRKRGVSPGRRSVPMTRARSSGTSG